MLPQAQCESAGEVRKDSQAISEIQCGLADLPRRRAQGALRELLFIGLLGCFVCPQAWCLDRDRSINQFYHTAWTAKEGAPSQIYALAQTADGYLWIGSQRGLFQFDGVQFRPYEPPPGVRFPSNNINSLMATPDGGLWVSFNPSGVGFLKGGRFISFDQPRFELASFVRDLDGRIWAGTRTGLLLFDGNDWLEIKENWNFTGHRIWTMSVDRSGTLWVAVDSTLAFLHRGSKTFQQTGAHLAGVPEIAQAMDGQLWLSQWDRPLQAIDNDGRILPSPKILDKAVHFLFDRDGSLWMVGDMEGVCRLRFPERLGERIVSARDPELERFTEREGLTGNAAINLLEDREGNIWIATNKGLNRFRHSQFVPVELPSVNRLSTLMAGNQGEVWIGNDQLSPILHIRGDKIIPTTMRARISSVYRESDDTVWWGCLGGILRQRDDRFDFFPQPKRLAVDWVWEIFQDDRGGLWVGFGDFGLIHFKDGVWTFPRKPEGLPDVIPSASFHETNGRTWLGYPDERAILLAGEQVHEYSQADGIDIGRVRVIRGHGSQIFFGGGLGLAVFEQGRFTRVNTGENWSFGAVAGIVEAFDGGVWLNEQHGIVRISPSDVAQLAKDPSYPVHPQIYDFLDGLPGAPQHEFRSSTAIQATDGRLWFATDNGLTWIDPMHLSKNTLPPPVAITALNAEQKQYGVSGVIRLPRGTTTLRIEYTGLSFSIPERVRFRYKLEGLDKDWHDGGNRREAVYNNLGPGPYQFRIIAANNDGVWNEEGSRLIFSIAPLWFQTIWFRLLCVAAFGFVVWGIYQIRVRQIEQQFNLGLEARVHERTRIARELHDTLLQSLHGLMFEFQAARNMFRRNPEQAMQALDEAILGTEEAITESRDAIQNLRSEPLGDRDLAESLTANCQELAASHNGSGPVPKFHIIVEGERRNLAPTLQEDVYSIAREVLRNAFRHSEAQRIETEIRYGVREFRLRVRDDGKGIGPAVLEKGGKAGHWGLSGMRERAEQIGAQLSLWSQCGAGTEVQLTLPASAAYGEPHNGSRTKPKISGTVRRYDQRS